jgi:WS/DGAT/MGAT family acyltransferase
VSSDLRSIGVTSMPLDRLRAVSRQAGCTINDVVLTLTDAALHDYLARHGTDPTRSLVAMCPMSLRQPGDSTANSQLATLLVQLGRPGADLRERLEQVAASAGRAKRDARAISRDGLIDFVLVIGGAFELLQRSGLDRLVPQSYNVLVSNVPGPGTKDMYLAGARLLASYPISTLTPGNNLNLTVLSHGNSVDFGLLAARGTLPDIDYLVERLDYQYGLLVEEFGVAEAADEPAAASGARRRRGAAANRGAAAKRKAARPKTAATRSSPAQRKESAKPKTPTRRRASAKRRPPATSGTATGRGRSGSGAGK